MLPSKLMSLVKKIESGSKVDLKYMGVDCWPVVRNTFMSLVGPSFTGKARKKQTKQLYLTMQDFIRLFFFSKKVDALVLTDKKFQAKANGKLYYKDASVIKELLLSSGKRCQILTQNESEKNDKQDKSSSIFVMTVIALITSRVLMWGDFTQTVSTYIKKIYNCNELQNSSFKSGHNSKKIEKNIYFVIVASFLFGILLRRLRPKKAYVVCYYSCLGMALCVACKKLGIEVADIQHGVSGSNMRAYGQWGSIPLKGYNTLPKSFYCWTAIDVKAIESWSKKTSYHRVFLTGNIWHQYLVERDHSVLPEELMLARQAKEYEKVVLYTAQRRELPQQIVDLIEKAPWHIFFMIRMHPNSSAYELSLLANKLDRVNINYSIVKATKSRVHKVMQLADCHVTEWSAAVYDAYLEGLSSIVISPYGEDYFDAWIELGIVRYSSKLTSLDYLSAKDNITVCPTRSMDEIKAILLS